jgi:hypothetical protein
MSDVICQNVSYLVCRVNRVSQVKIFWTTPLSMSLMIFASVIYSKILPSFSSCFFNESLVATFSDYLSRKKKDSESNNRTHSKYVRSYSIFYLIFLYNNSWSRMIDMLKLLSVFGKYASRTTTSRSEGKTWTNNILHCVFQSCENRVICRCAVCSEHICYEHAHTHPHDMINFEVLKL